MNKKYNLLYLFSAAIICTAYMVSTYGGIGVDGDSVTYFKMADRIYDWISGGFRSLNYNTYYYHFPPLYVIFLLPANFIKVSYLEYGRVLNGILLLLNLILIYKIESKLQAKPLILLSSMAIFGFVLLHIHSLALSEELFYFFILLFFYTLLKGVNTLKLHISMIIVLVAATLTRYAGVVLLMVYLVSSVSPEERGKNRFVPALRDILIASIPIIFYVVLGYINKKQLADRSVGIYLYNFGKFILYYNINWLYLFFPIEFLTHIPFGNAHRYILAGMFSLLFGFMVFKLIYLPLFSYYKKRWLERKKVYVFFVFILMYYVFVALSRLFLDAFIPPSIRLFSPMLFPLVFMWGYVLSHNKYNKFLLYTYLFLLTASGLSVSSYGKHNGWGYTSRRWKYSPTLAFIRDSLNVNKPIMTNVPDVFYLYFNSIKVNILPFKYNPWNLHPAPFYKDTVRGVADRVRKGSVVIVYFKGYWKHSMDDKDIYLLTGLKPFRKFTDGVIFKSTFR